MLVRVPRTKVLRTVVAILSRSSVRPRYLRRSVPGGLLEAIRGSTPRRGPAVGTLSVDRSANRPLHVVREPFDALLDHAVEALHYLRHEIVEHRANAT